MMMKMKINYAYPVLIAAIWFLLVWSKLVLGYYGGAIGLVCLIGILCALLLRSNTVSDNQIVHPTGRLALFAGWCIGAVSIVWYATYLYHKHPIDIRVSDIIPLIGEVYYQRFVNGEYVYATVHGYDYIEWTPNYLPMHWLPFVPAFALQSDPRYIPLIAFLAVQAVYVYFVSKENLPTAEKWIKSLLPLAMLASIMHKQPVSFAHTVELLIVSYYILLMIGLVVQQYAYTTAGLFFTGLSRYISVFFIPVHAFVMWQQQRKNGIIIYAVLFALVLAVYVIPFVSQQPTVFFDGAKAYDAAALGEWKGQSWQEPGSLPYQLFQGYGFAAIIYQLYQSDLMVGIQLIKMCMFATMLLLVAGWCIVLNNKPNSISYLPIVLLTIITGMLVWVTVPYDYLYWNILFMLPIITMKQRWF